MINKEVFGKLPFEVNDRITVLAVRHHSKAGEAYLDVRFTWPGQPAWEGSVPVNYRATGLNAVTLEDCEKILISALAAWNELARKVWAKEALAHWTGRKAEKTRPFFDKLFQKVGQWVCQNHELPANPNWARRTQDIKGIGFTLATHTKLWCDQCNAKKTHIMLLPIPLGSGFRYETMSRSLVTKIIRTLKSYDAFEGKVVPSASLLPDHKFPEVRWLSETAVENPETMTDDQIRAKFQLLTNQKNLTKREVCRGCKQTGLRGYPFGIKFFSVGTQQWPKDIPDIGEKAEAGCIGCGWYDFEAWRVEIKKRIE